MFGIVGTGVLDGPLQPKAALFAVKFAHRGQILPNGPSRTPVPTIKIEVYEIRGRPMVAPTMVTQHPDATKTPCFESRVFLPYLGDRKINCAEVIIRWVHYG